MNEDEFIVCRQSELAAAMEKCASDAIAQGCKLAFEVARERSGVLLVVHDQNTRLRQALTRLLDSTEHAKHNCGDSVDDCPVAFARHVLRGPVRQ